MRKSLVAGNWKMNKTIAETRDLVFKMSVQLREIDGVEKVICPPFISLMAASALLEGSGIGLGAQNMHWEEKGAFTGEVAPAMVNEIVNRKLIAAQKADLTPIVCVGETLEQYESKQTREVVSAQTRESLKGVPAELAPRIVVAYEPVWAIGTGKASNGPEANTVVKDVIRPALAELFGKETAQAIRVLYGGSVTSANAAEFFEQPDIDGALVGGASLKIDEFVAITKAAVK
jgi:triosephosphate isomerase